MANLSGDELVIPIVAAILLVVVLGMTWKLLTGFGKKLGPMSEQERHQYKTNRDAADHSMPTMPSGTGMTLGKILMFLIILVLLGAGAFLAYSGQIDFRP